MKKALACFFIIVLVTGCSAITENVQLPEAAEPQATQTEVWEVKLTGEIPAPEPIPTEAAVEEPLPAETTENTPATAQPEPADEELVLIKDYIPDIMIDLKYATTDNFTGVVIYDSGEALLRYGTVKKLMLVQEELHKEGYSLIVWDAFRPVEAQFKLWDICPDPAYVANPYKGFSKHSRGNTVDISIVALDGSSVEMPSAFDDFSALADRMIAMYQTLPGATPTCWKTV